MDTADMIQEHTETTVVARTACGHWSRPIHVASSTWDYPDEPVACATCGEARYMDTTLIVDLIARRDAAWADEES